MNSRDASPEPFRLPELESPGPRVRQLLADLANVDPPTAATLLGLAKLKRTLELEDDLHGEEHRQKRARNYQAVEKSEKDAKERISPNEPASLESMAALLNRLVRDFEQAREDAKKEKEDVKREKEKEKDDAKKEREKEKDDAKKEREKEREAAKKEMEDIKAKLDKLTQDVHDGFSRNEGRRLQRSRQEQNHRRALERKVIDDVEWVAVPNEAGVFLCDEPGWAEIPLLRNQNDVDNLSKDHLNAYSRHYRLPTHRLTAKVKGSNLVNFIHGNPSD